jgi:uncharacterized membrane protein YkoI
MPELSVEPGHTATQGRIGKMIRRRVLFVLAASLLPLASFSGIAVSDDKKKRHRREITKEVEVHQDEVRDALKRNQIRPMSEVLAVAERVMPGQMIGVKVLRLDGTLVYEFKIINEMGRLREVYVDAVTLEIVKVE